jgi:adenylate cyclase
MTAAGLLCGSCGAQLSAKAKFCSECGAPATSAPKPAEYKQVTVLFADVVHSMDIAAAVGPERLREIMAALVDRAAAVVTRYGGTLDKFTGDGIMAVFGAPAALEDQALRGCLAALGIQEEAKRLVAEVRERDDVDAAGARAFQTAASAALRSRICSTAWISGAPTDCAVALRQAM